MLHEQSNPPGSWSIAIPQMTEDEALSALNIYDAGGHLSLRHRCFVSAVGLKSVTISGSPAALNRFAESLTASQPSRKIIWLPIFAGYHAAHIHTVLDFSSFLSRCGIDADLLSSFKSIKSLLSPLTGQPVDSGNALGLFKTVVHHTLQAPLRLDLIVERCAAFINENAISSVTIDAVGPTPVTDGLAAALRNRTSANVSVRELVAFETGLDQYRPSAAFSHAPLAIVGMSGRFPGAENADALWDLLEAGLDLHRVIPKDRFDVETHVDTSGKAKNTSWTPYGCFIDQPRLVDPRFFNMSPREAPQTDPDAELDRDNVLAVILGAGTNHSANAISITHPHAETQSNLYCEVLERSGVDPLDVGYVEMHGTGTQAGDGTEMRSVVDVFGPLQPGRSEDNPLYVGAVKANIGHGEASSGVASLVKAILVLQHSAIPPHIGIKKEINGGVRVPFKKTQFQSRNGKKKTILANNFSAAGGNTALLIQEPPSQVVLQDIKPRPLHLVTVSGHTKSALQNNLDNLIAYLTANPDTSPVDLSYTTTARRRHHALRLSVTESSIDRIKLALKQKRHLPLSSASTSQGSRQIVFVFTGQGAAYPALAHELYVTSSQFRADIDHFDGIARQQGFPSFLSIIDGSAGDLNVLSPIQTQIGLVCIQVALARLWSSLGIKPAAVLGHSLGEYAALQVSGVLSISDMIYLVGYRARLLENRCEMFSHAMLAAAESAPILHQKIPARISSDVQIACENSPRETVLAGTRAVIDEVESHLSASGIRSTKLQVPYAFHSAQVDPILNNLEEVARVVKMGAAQVPIISSVTGRALDHGEQIDAHYLRQHCRQPVEFLKAVQNARDVGLIQESSVFIEVGPHPICSAMIKSTLGDIDIHTLATLRRKENPWKVIVGSLTSLHDFGFIINRSEYHRDFEGACRLLTLPAYAFDNKNYWIEYKNDWTLRKGDPRLAPNDSLKTPKNLSSSVHRIVKEDYAGPTPIVVFETDLSSTEIHTAIGGHRVNGSALCPSSMYADVALTIDHHKQQQPESGFSTSGHNITAMEVHHPLIIKPSREDETRVLRIYARPNRQTQTIKVEYVSVLPTQKTETKHATCTIESADAEKWLRRWSHDLYLIQDRIAHLKKLAEGEGGEVSKITRRLAYRLFGSLVDYAPEYQRMEHVLLSSVLFEATVNVRLDDSGDDASFFCSPYWIDALLHLSGFIMIGNDTLDYNDAVYISHGWEGMRLAKPLNPNGNYQVYVRMFPRDKTMVGGNACILCDGEVVGLAEDLRFQRVPRTLLDMLLPPVGLHRKVPEREVVKADPAPIVPQVSATEFRVVATRSNQDGILDTIASELGLSPSEVSPDDRLHDLGVDSLMSLTLASKLIEHFAISISHVELMDCPTIGDLLNMLRDKTGGVRSESSSVIRKKASNSASSNQPLSSPEPFVAPESSGPETSGGDTAGLVRLIILEETGISTKDLEPDVDLSTLGVDSLMSLTVLARLREVGIELPTTFFMENRSMNEVFRALAHSVGVATPASQSTERTDTEQHALLPSHQARLILLQRRVNPASTGNLFLFPDGSGSPFAYAALEQINPDFDVYGLICPFINTPEDYTIGIEALVQIYLTVIREQQPKGPYHFGGWSVGGVLAYEATKQLIEAGHRVQSLNLIDAPCPLKVPPMSPSLIAHLASKGVFSQLEGGSGPRDKEKHQNLLKHFNSTVQNLAVYKPSPISSASQAPQTLVLWAEEGVDGALPSARSSHPVSATTTESWILHDRSSFGPHGWDSVLPLQSISMVSVPGNHFSMMAGQNVSFITIISEDDKGYDTNSGT
ncbi:hypothetical protein BDV12DRAFT_199618 [Aspergillus spectabilis]